MSTHPADLTAVPHRDARDLRAEHVLMARAMALIYLSGVGFVLLWALLLDGFDILSYGAALLCLLFGVGALLAERMSFPKRAFLPPLLLGVLIQLVMSTHLQQANAGFFLLLPAMYCTLFFWDDRPVLLTGTTIAVLAFIAQPLLAGAADPAARLAMTTPIFVGLVLITGYLGHEAAETSRNRDWFKSTISSLLVTLQERDGYTADHSEETVALGLAVGRELGLSEEELTVLADVALLHDIGKIGIPNEILNKRAGLDKHEWEFMKRHPEIGERIVAPVPGFGDVAKAIRHEHERWDGGGYPDGLVGEAIPLHSRIVFACDALHAMITDRPYRKAIGLTRARAELVQNAGTQFDPRVISALLTVIDVQGLPDEVGHAAWSPDQQDDSGEAGGLRLVAG